MKNLNENNSWAGIEAIIDRKLKTESITENLEETSKLHYVEVSDENLNAAYFIDSVPEILKKLDLFTRSCRGAIETIHMRLNGNHEAGTVELF